MRDLPLVALDAVAVLSGQEPPAGNEDLAGAYRPVVLEDTLRRAVGDLGGRVPAGESFSWLWASIHREARLGESGPRGWDLHVITRSAASASAVLDHLGGRPP